MADDEPGALETIKRLLDDARADGHTAALAAEALAMVEADPPDVLICDIGMPVEDGDAMIGVWASVAALARR